MSTISGTTSSTGSTGSSTSTSPAAAAAAAEAAAEQALKEADESIIGSATGDSSMDVQTLVSALVTSKVAGQTAGLTAQEATDNSQISALGQLMSSLSSLQTAVEPLYDGAMLTSYTATASGSGITATAGVGAVAGTYSLDVTQVASAQSITSSAFSTTAAASLGTGALTISVGKSSMTLNVSSTNDSLSQIAAGINSADDNPGVTASVVTGANGQYLVMTANSTGAANTINISASSASTSALQGLAFTTPQSVTSSAFSTGAAASLGTGALTISVGSSSMTLNVTSSNDSLSQIAASINSADNNPGITASVVTGANGQSLVLTANSTGAATINVSASSESSSGLQSLSSTSAWTQTAPAQDAEFTVNGTSATSSSNTVTGVISGVTLSLTSAAVDTSGDGAKAQTLTVAPNTASEITDISNFVTAYNSVVSTIGTLTAFNPSTSSSSSTAGPLLGNSLVNDVRFALGNIVAGSVSSGGQSDTLAALGITLNDDGTLSLDTTTLSSAVVSDPQAVQTVFNLSNGIGAQLNNAITPYTEPDGTIDSNISSVTANLTSLTTQTNTLTSYSDELTSQYNAQFTALDSYMATTNSDEQYLTALFGGANSAGSLAKSSS